MRRFHALAPRARSIVFYAEDRASWGHFGPMVSELTGPLGCEICYLTSAPDDPILTRNDDRIHAFYVGAGAVRTFLFLTMKAGVVVMTMPDLETFHIKRSRVWPVHYVYVFHSMVSTHMIYRRGAFDHYDTILCVGPHHVQEIRATERRHELAPKQLVEHGYGRLDSILRDQHRGQQGDPGQRDKQRVLIAPSWGPHGLLETLGRQLTGILLDAGYHVTVRPHPEMIRRHPEVIHDLRQHFQERAGFVLEMDVSSAESLGRADIMISDWSGAALEYAFGFERPVLFVDLPRKVNNPEYDGLNCEPIEVTIREQIGAVVSPDDLGAVPREIERLCRSLDAFRERIREARSRTVYNVGTSGAVGASHIARIADAVMHERSVSDGLVPAAS